MTDRTRQHPDDVPVPREPRGPVRRVPAGATADLADYACFTPAERVAMMWQLAVDAWTFTGTFDPESRLQRHLVELRRRGR